MTMKKSAVINTSPWIALCAAGQAELLRKLFENIVMPKAVYEEIMAGGKGRTGLKELEKTDWLLIRNIQDVSKTALLHELDRGEAEVIILAQEQGITQVIIDEKIARMQAQVSGLTVIGTLGLLLRAKRLGLIDQIKPLTENILKAGIYIHREIVKGILQEAGE
ncbi:MAG: DUF3368 domain-containing protein [Desulfococcaceae bacterium]